MLNCFENLVLNSGIHLSKNGSAKLENNGLFNLIKRFSDKTDKTEYILMKQF